MPRQRFIPSTGEWVELVRRIPQPRIYINTDSIDPLWHPADGHYYDSKSQFRLVTKMHGCVERGTDHIPPKQYEPDLNEIRDCVEQSVAKLEQGYKPAQYGGKDEQIDAGFMAAAEKAVQEAAGK